MACVSSAVGNCIPHRTIGPNENEHSIPGWNDYVEDKHELARNAYLDWVYCGRPREGPVQYRMKATRARFKLAVRYCRLNTGSTLTCYVPIRLRSHWLLMIIVSSGKL